MKSKYELTISTGYVPDWTYVEAVRELFQNAIDNERVNPENKMGISHNGTTLEISNKTSKLTLDSLLLGSSTKRDDDRTIGQHGEGYKIAFMVLLREGKNITVENYGADEIWTTKLVNSRRYNGAKVVQIEVEKNPFWKKNVKNDLNIIVEGISDSEYDDIVNANLFLQDKVNASEMTRCGQVLFGDDNVGKIFVKGLYVSTVNSIGLRYGYNFDTNGIKLDRDRKLVSSFDISYYASQIWAELSRNNEYTDDIADMVQSKAPDVEYLRSNIYLYKDNLGNVADKIVENLKEEYGDKVYPVTDNEEYRVAERSGLSPVIVSSNVKEIASLSSNVAELSESEDLTLLERIENFKDKIEGKLSDEELKEFEDIMLDLRDRL